VIYNAVADIFQPTPDKQLREENYIVAVSSFKANKNFFKSYKAFVLAKTRIQNLKFYVIGDLTSNNFKCLQSEIDEMRNDADVRFLGRLSDEEMVKYYSNAKAFVFASFYEGFGIPVLEAQACGCPVVCSNLSSLPEVVQNSALTFNPNSINEIADAIVDVVTDDTLSKRLIVSGSENYRRFSWANEAVKIKNIINSL
jgi:glycosyltransferase involved in cell wall biosynthesis